jgi:hypothetical protein
MNDENFKEHWNKFCKTKNIKVEVTDLDPNYFEELCDFYELRDLAINSSLCFQFKF